MIRVAPDVRGDTHDHISTGQADTKFGFSLADAPTAMERIRGSERLRLRGVHLHIGSQLLELDPFRARDRGGRRARPIRRDQRRRRPRRRLHARRPSAVGARVRAVKVGAIREYLGPDVAILDEPGRALVARPASRSTGCNR